MDGTFGHYIIPDKGYRVTSTWWGIRGEDRDIRSMGHYIRGDSSYINIS